MGTYSKFEELPVWQKANELVTEIYKVTNNEAFKVDYGLKEQIRRAAVSISSNIAEGFERESKEEFIYFLYVARGSAGEVRSQLYVAKNLGYLLEEEFKRVNTLCESVSKQISGFIDYLKKTSIKGQKFISPGAKERQKFWEELKKYSKK
ncbi:MAG: four helix bundle protein [bacterium]|nr:four helix bundle protein [bacterium]